MGRAEVLARFEDHLVSYPYCSDDKTARYQKPREEIHKYGYVSLNQRLAFYLSFDIDRESAMFAAEASGLPIPTIAILNESNGHVHFHYELIEPVTCTVLGRPRPIRYLAAIENAFANRMETDAGFSSFMIKNPLFSDWWVATNDKTYSLGELAEYVEREELLALKRKPSEVCGFSRHCDLFDKVRRWAYRQCANFDRFETWFEAVLEKCRAGNIYKDPLPDSHVRSTAKSISKWVWVRRSKFKFKPKLTEREIYERERQGALYTLEVRRRKGRQADIEHFSAVLQTGLTNFLNHN